MGSGGGLCLLTLLILTYGNRGGGKQASWQTGQQANRPQANRPQASRPAGKQATGIQATRYKKQATRYKKQAARNKKVREACGQLVGR